MMDEVPGALAQTPGPHPSTTYFGAAIVLPERGGQRAPVKSGAQGSSAASLRMASVMSIRCGTDAISSTSASPIPGMNLPARSRDGAES